LRYLRAHRRDAGRDVEWLESDDLASLLDLAPTPEEEAMIAETIESLLGAMTRDDRPIVEHLLLGYTAQETATRLGCSERTVRRVRQRAEDRVRRLVDPRETGSPKVRGGDASA